MAYSAQSGLTAAFSLLMLRAFAPGLVVFRSWLMILRGLFLTRSSEN
jgi:hypothetical protein